MIDTEVPLRTNWWRTTLAVIEVVGRPAPWCEEQNFLVLCRNPFLSINQAQLAIPSLVS